MQNALGLNRAKENGMTKPLIRKNRATPKWAKDSHGKAYRDFSPAGTPGDAAGGCMPSSSHAAGALRKKAPMCAPNASTAMRRVAGDD
ncbi:MAG: hypothetical protein AAB215_00970, partial [Planctomycetota bacterium]